MSTIPISQLLDRLTWRYATKVFDPRRKVSDADWAALENALVLSPSSYGLQPYKFLVITDQAVKDRLVPAAWGQRQVADCSHHVVFAIRKDLDEAYVDNYLARVAELRGGSVEALAPFRQTMIGDLISGPRSATVSEWAARQAYLALGNLITSAALLGIDTCPMEGFQPQKYDEILGLPVRSLASVVVCAVGYRAATDKYATLPKVRFAAADIIERI